MSPIPVFGRCCWLFLASCDAVTLFLGKVNTFHALVPRQKTGHSCTIRSGTTIYFEYDQLVVKQKQIQNFKQMERFIRH